MLTTPTQMRCKQDQLRSEGDTADASVDCTELSDHTRETVTRVRCQALLSFDVEHRLQVLLSHQARDRGMTRSVVVPRSGLREHLTNHAIVDAAARVVTASAGTRICCSHN